MESSKQILEKNRIIEDRTTSDYLKDFQRINDDLQNIVTTNDWWELYVRLVNWQLKFEGHDDRGLDNILFEQMQSCNKEFSRFIENNYEDLLKENNNSILSPGVFKNHILPLMNDKNKHFIENIHVVKNNMFSLKILFQHLITCLKVS